MSPAQVDRERAAGGGTLLPSGVTCSSCADVGWPDCGTARDLYCVASDLADEDTTVETVTVQDMLW